MTETVFAIMLFRSDQTLRQNSPLCCHYYPLHVSWRHLPRSGSRHGYRGDKSGYLPLIYMYKTDSHTARGDGMIYLEEIDVINQTGD